MWGITTSNFAGSNGVLINPTAIVTSKLYLDINLATADFFFQNNYAYIHKEDRSLFKYLSRNPQFPSYGEDDMPFDHFRGKNNITVYSSQLLKGPSFMLTRGRHAFALHTGARVLSSGFSVPYHVANFGYYGLDYTPQHNIEYNDDNVTAAALVTGEIGITYAYSFRKFSMDDWSAGITVRRYFSLSGGYMNASNVNYIVVNDSTINIKNMDAEFGYSLPMNYDNNDFPYEPWIKGGGFSADIGVTYQSKLLSYQKKRITRLCSQRYVDYIYKIGISVIDLGFVNFTNNAQLHDYDNVSQYWINVDTLSYDNMNQIMGVFSQVFYNDPDESLKDDRIRVHLPTAISIQGDYKVHRNWYAGGVFIYPVRLGKAYIHRPAQIALVPRYETPYLEFSLPVSLYEWHYPRVGFSLRYHFLTIGTDDLAGLFGLSDFTGLDFYVSVKVNFRKGQCGRTNRHIPCENDEYGIRKRP
ncbi:MAG: hypothetical protein K0B08_10800 [Bacteroidales bacterium]|nr:hypothetical protein [Bacteroidales bacterium]